MVEEFLDGQDGSTGSRSRAKIGSEGSVRGPRGPECVLTPVPFSKSLLQRALLAAAWGGGETQLHFPSDPGLPGSQGVDVADLILALGALGLCIYPQPVESSGPHTWCLRAPGFRSLGTVTLALGESGTAARFCTVALAFAGVPGSVRTVAVSGTLGVRKSPALLASLSAAGVSIQSAGPGSWPLGLTSIAMPQELVIENPVSSQELSALLFALAFQGGQRLIVRGAIPSLPYVELTRAVLADFGVRFEVHRGGEVRFDRVIPEIDPFIENDVTPHELTVEADASSAAVAWAAGILAHTPVAVSGFARVPLQGDAQILQLLRSAGAHCHEPHAGRWQVQGPITTGWQANLENTPDLAPPLVALAAALAVGHFGTSQPSRFTGLGTLQGKESPRLEVLGQALQQVGIAAQWGADWLEIPVGTATTEPVVLNAQGDHRMAFAFGLLAIAVPSIQVQGRDCVAKSWPRFWTALEGILAGSTRASK
ncbi:MAG: 3-phosphoshikimate 1-carboxyvinyltransferase [Planctomycetota bacterium]|jgi:3-phosphoshikimate 1-carboxyvinyltransferase